MTSTACSRRSHPMPSTTSLGIRRGPPWPRRCPRASTRASSPTFPRASRDQAQALWRGASWWTNHCGAERRPVHRSDCRAGIARSSSGCCTSSNSPMTAPRPGERMDRLRRDPPPTSAGLTRWVPGTPGRPNQRSRTRKDLLDAASRLLKQGRRPTLEEVAEEARVSRATAYRYFPSVETFSSRHRSKARPLLLTTFFGDASIG